jgi:formylglycine-generating enzyme required for sulfatase activity
MPRIANMPKRKIGITKDYLDFLLLILDLFFDLSDSTAANGWKMIEEKAGEKYKSLLKSALTVQWEKDRSRLFVTCDRMADHDGEKGVKDSGDISQIGTLAAILECLKLTSRIKTDDPKYQDTTPVNDAIGLLDRLGILTQEFPKKKKTVMVDGKEKTIEEDNIRVGFRSMWIYFEGFVIPNRKKCKKYVENKWENLRSEKPAGRKAGAHAVFNPEAWVNSHLKQWRELFQELPDVRDRELHVPLKAAITLNQSGTVQQRGEAQIREPAPSDIQSIVANNKRPQLLMIWDEGGAGKTSLAIEIARWAMDGKLADFAILPILLDFQNHATDLVESLKSQLSYVDKDLTLDNVGVLLEQRRLLVIVDHFSECTGAQQSWLLAQCTPSNLSLLLLTSRQNEGDKFRGWQRHEIRPQRLQDADLFRFFEDYLFARSKQAATSQSSFKATTPLLSPEDQVRTRDLLERMVGNKPITVLLAWMVIEKAIEHIEKGRVDLLPSSVPDLMLNYVERCSKAIQPEKQYLVGEPKTIIDSDLIETILKALALAAHQQEDHAYKPQNFGLKVAQQALTKTLLNDAVAKDKSQLLSLLRYLDQNHSLLQCKNESRSSPEYRISLDPLADYLAALALIEELTDPTNRSSLEDQLSALQTWLATFSDRLEREDQDRRSSMHGFLAACRDVSKDWATRLPESVDPHLRQQCNLIPFRFAQLAGIDPLEERFFEARHLIRRHAGDLVWANPELRPKAIAELSAYAREFTGANQPKELQEAVGPLTNTLQKTTLNGLDRAAAAEALGLIGGQKAAGALKRMINDDQERWVAVRRAAAEALGLLDASPDDRQRHWDLLEGILADQANHLDGEANQAVIDAKLPLLQGASRGLQRLATSSLASPSHSAPSHVWGTGPGLKVPMLTLSTNGKAVTTRLLANVEVWQVPLPGGVPLEVVAIPDGNYTIGSPPSEGGRDAYPLVPQAERGEVEAMREVRLDLTSAWGVPFAMSRFPITQVQWRTLAGAERQKEKDRALNPDPSQHKGVDLPVQNVSWYDCQEWIKRLNRWLNDEWQKGSKEGAPLRLALPAESLWEIASRAGSTLPLPFHFGDTLDAAWANYDGNYTYSGGRQGTYIQRPTAVGAYGLANRWGLADLHGNVAEWCADLWHPSPLGAPDDGRPWMDLFDGLLAEEQRVLLRGGSWFVAPHYCRSAFRDGLRPANSNDCVGFRVCCLPPGLPSWSFDP